MDAGSPLILASTIHGHMRHLDQGRLDRLLSYAAHQEGVQGQLSILICDDAEIARLHRNFMGIDGPTDVMSFPGEDDDSRMVAIPPISQGERHLGDIAVSFETAAAQAAEVGHSTEREVAFLLLHGLLHLAGYDDLDPESRQQMLNRQEWLLTSFEEANPGDWG